MDNAPLEDQQIKHLEMIQGVISRLANNSFLIKGWAITVTGAFLGFAVDATDSALAVASALPTLAFWALDTHFLRSERLFRALFDRARTIPPGVEPFFMGGTSAAFVESISGGPKPDLSSWWVTAARPTLALHYGGLLASAGGVALAIGL